MRSPVLAILVILAGLCPPRAAGESAFHLRRLASDPAGGGDAALRPDGDAFVTSSRRGGNWDLWLFDIATGQWRQLTDDPAEDFEAQWSPDASRLVFTSTRAGQKDVWVLRLADGALTRLTDSGGDDEYPQWSPDGRGVVYTGGSWGVNDFFVVPAAGGAPRKVSPTPGRGGACSFAPDGASLICHRYETGNGDLLRIDLATGRAAAVTSGPAWDYKPALSPDARWIAFSRSLEGPSQVWVMPAGGGAGHPLVESGTDDRWPGWSAAGDRLFFHRTVVDGVAVELLDRQTRKRRVLVRAEESPLQASLDSAGRRLVYCVQEKGRRSLRLRDLATGEVRPLPVAGEGACFPRWSPDGSRIAFALRRGERWEMAMLDPGSGAVRVWTAGVAGLRGLDGPLDWAPDGSAIVFQGDTEPFASDLYLLDLERGVVRNLTQDAWFEEGPAWSRDGRSIVYMSTRGGGWTWGLYRLSLEDGAVSVVAPPDYVEKGFPRPGPGGEVVWSFRDGEGAEHLAEAAGGELKTLQAPPGARWPSYTADGRGILYTVLTENVEYWLAENPFGTGSPLRAQPAADAISPPAPVSRPLAAGTGRSPVDLFHR